MANVWKIGSRWSENGTWNSRIISIFRRSGVVFLGDSSTDRFSKEVKTGDYFAIADGYSIPAVARAISDPVPLDELISKNIIKVRPNEPFDITEDYSGCYGVRVKIVDLPADELLYYEKRGTFFKANAIREQVIKLYEEGLNTKFDIKAKTCRLFATRGQNDGKESIINPHIFYDIPVYQREYSWGRNQVTRFLNDIFRGFWSTDEQRIIRKEPLFIGTMQLSYKKYISSVEFEQDIIDGQQRISTLMCLLKFLKLSFPENKLLRNIRTDWLETRVNNGKEDSYLKDMLLLKHISDAPLMNDIEHNRYGKNLIIIHEVFTDLITDESGNVITLFIENIDSFVEYILNDIYFVVVETVAGLSKTIQIFNTINTAGLDLNGNDLFKVRFYEYLHDVKNMGEDAFNEIGEIYKDVKKKNAEWRKRHDCDILGIGRIRSIYKYYLISRYKLPVSLYSKSTDTFFDELFDVLLNVQQHNEYKNLKGLELSLDEFKRMKDVAYFWNTSSFKKANDYISYTLIQRSRYSKYNNIAYQILLSNEAKPDSDRIDDVYECLRLLARLFFCWSIQYAKAVNEIHSFMYGIYRDVADYQSLKSEIFTKIRQKIATCNNDWFKNEHIGQAIAYNRIMKELICVLSAYLYEIENNTPLNQIEALFEGGYDIEHIHANANDKEGTDISDVLQHGIGNLMVLEKSINRSIGCLPFAEKVNRSDSKLCYKDSKYAVVKDIMTYQDWDMEEIEQRRIFEINRISDFLFNHI